MKIIISLLPFRTTLSPYLHKTFMLHKKKRTYQLKGFSWEKKRYYCTFPENCFTCYFFVLFVSRINLLLLLLILTLSFLPWYHQYHHKDKESQILYVHFLYHINSCEIDYGDNDTSPLIAHFLTYSHFQE